MAGKTDYFNFPILLVQEFMTDHKRCLRQLLHYSIYKYMYDEIDCFEDDLEESLDEAAEHFSVKLGDPATAFKEGQALFDSLDNNLPLVGITREVFWNYHDNEKTEYEKILLLAYLALRSILGEKSYVNVKNEFWFSRMAGRVSTLKSIDILPPRIAKYNTEHYQRKIKNDLQLEWGMKHYAYRTRGFYVSWRKSYKWLVFEVESKKKARKVQGLKESQKKERKEVMEILIANHDQK